MAIDKERNVFYRTRRENPVQFKIFWALIVGYLLLALFNYLFHAFLYSVKDYGYYKSHFDFPFFAELDWLLIHPQYSTYANAYAEYMVWGVGLYALMCLAALVALINLFATSPRPRRVALLGIAVILACLGILGVSTVLSANTLDATGMTVGFHPGVTLFPSSLGRMCLFPIILILAMPAFVKNAKETLRNPPAA